MQAGDQVAHLQCLLSKFRPFVSSPSEELEDASLETDELPFLGGVFYRQRQGTDPCVVFEEKAENRTKEEALDLRFDSQVCFLVIGMKRFVLVLLDCFFIYLCREESTHCQRLEPFFVLQSGRLHAAHRVSCLTPREPEGPLQPPRQTHFSPRAAETCARQTEEPTETAKDETQLAQYRRAFSALRKRTEAASQRQRLSLAERERVIADLKRQTQTLQAERRRLEEERVAEAQRAQRLESEAFLLRREVEELQVRDLSSSRAVGLKQRLLGRAC